jgi:hypothetical protein
MAYASSEARQELLDSLAEAVDHIGLALALVGAAYEQLDEHSADRLEEALFRPTQLAYGRAKRTHSGFAQRHGLPGRSFEAASSGLPSQGVKGFLDRAAEELGDAEAVLVEIQDSMAPVEVGDPELRAGLAEVREIVGPLADRADEAVRGFGR